MLIKKTCPINNLIVLQLDPEESSLLWRFRYSLLSNPKALPKFVFAVDWNDESESSLATGMDTGVFRVVF